MADRFVTPRMTLFIDRAMTWFIKVGGIGIVIVVSLIFVFIFWQILPLFRSASLTPAGDIATAMAADGKEAAAAIGVDEWGEVPFVFGRDGALTFCPIDAARKPYRVDAGLGAGKRITAALYEGRSRRLVAGASDGTLALITVAYDAAFAGAQRTITGSAKLAASLTVVPAGRSLIGLGYGQEEEGKALAGVISAAGDGSGARQVEAVFLERESSLGGAGALRIANRRDLSAQVRGTPVRVLVTERADSLAVITDAGEIFYFFHRNDDLELRQVFKPFEHDGDPHIASADFLLGDVSLVLTNPQGINCIYSLCLKNGSSVRQFERTKELPPLPGGAACYAVSARNKSFLVASGTTLSLRYGTSATVRWEGTLPFTPTAAVINSKQSRVVLLDREQRLHLYELEDKYPEAGFQALFGKVWYEGADAPKYEWQSTGGSDDFEPKLSMVPLIWGTIKGTFYAMLFAVPIALLAAIYTAEFMHPRLKVVVKPVVEIMASLPSVVLGFLAALWLAPLLEHRVPSVLMVLLIVPTAAMAFGGLWARLPPSQRTLIKRGYEFLAFMPILLAITWLAWASGPLVEAMVFKMLGLIDPFKQPIVDFPQWWRSHVGDGKNWAFDQRNSLVVGIMMGFAVIPIIYTIAEDALSNVPPTLRSGSLALGASRWQTAFRVVVPTASAGIFSALMIGLGRAIGETMIVVMATGNTGVIDLNIFNGMRTLSANIAVEMPEADVGGTLYRTLFLGALLLFLMTFVINTVAELLRQYLRDKYKTV